MDCSNMEMRAQEMKGACEYRVEPGKGTTVHFRFPIP